MPSRRSQRVCSVLLGAVALCLIGSPCGPVNLVTCAPICDRCIHPANGLTIAVRVGGGEKCEGGEDKCSAGHNGECSQTLLENQRVCLIAKKDHNQRCRKKSSGKASAKQFRWGYSLTSSLKSGTGDVYLPSIAVTKPEAFTPVGGSPVEEVIGEYVVSGASRTIKHVLHASWDGGCRCGGPDNSSSNSSFSANFFITVDNPAPVLTVRDDLSWDQNVPFAFVVSATDASPPGEKLTYEFRLDGAFLQRKDPLIRDTSYHNY